MRPPRLSSDLGSGKPFPDKPFLDKPFLALRERSRRLNELKRQVGGISQQMLTRTLKTLERDGMVERTVCPTTRPQVEYALTALGRSLSEPVRYLAQRARANLVTIHDNRLRYDANR